MAGGDPLLRHIRHAEDWLRRARTDWRGGNAPAAMLRLMLAEAEIRHARETGAGLPARRGEGAADRRARWSPAAAAMIAAAVLAAGLSYASMQLLAGHHDAVATGDGAVRGLPRGAGQAGGGIVRTIVRLNSGEFLMPEGGRTAAGPAAGDPAFVVPADLRTSSPTF